MEAWTQYLISEPRWLNYATDQSKSRWLVPCNCKKKLCHICKTGLKPSLWRLQLYFIRGPSFQFLHFNYQKFGQMLEALIPFVPRVPHSGNNSLFHFKNRGSGMISCIASTWISLGIHRPGFSFVEICRIFLLGTNDPSIPLQEVWLCRLSSALPVRVFWMETLFSMRELDWYGQRVRQVSMIRMYPKWYHRQVSCNCKR